MYRGIYKHFKGNMYEVVGTNICQKQYVPKVKPYFCARHTETNGILRIYYTKQDGTFIIKNENGYLSCENLIVYHSLDMPEIYWARPKNMFLETLDPYEYPVKKGTKRFQLIRSYEKRDK